MLFKFSRILITTAALTTALGSSMGWAIESTTGALQLSGSVPEIFSLQVRGVPGDLDLTPGTSVSDRLLAVLHIKRNMDVDTTFISSDTATGYPENGGTQAPMTAFSVTVANCTGITGATTAAQLALGTTDLSAGAPVALVAGIEEDCDLTGTWTTTAAGATFPLAGKFAVTLTMVMTSL